MTKITLTQAEWDNRHNLESNVMERAYALLVVSWESYTCFSDEDLMMIFFVKNDLVSLNAEDVVAEWRNNPSMVGGVEVVIDG